MNNESESAKHERAMDVEKQVRVREGAEKDKRRKEREAKAKEAQSSTKYKRESAEQLKEERQVDQDRIKVFHKTNAHVLRDCKLQPGDKVISTRLLSQRPILECCHHLHEEELSEVLKWVVLCIGETELMVDVGCDIIELLLRIPSLDIGRSAQRSRGKFADESFVSYAIRRSKNDLFKTLNGFAGGTTVRMPELRAAVGTSNGADMAVTVCKAIGPLPAIRALMSTPLEQLDLLGVFSSLKQHGWLMLGCFADHTEELVQFTNLAVWFADENHRSPFATVDNLSTLSTIAKQYGSKDMESCQLGCMLLFSDSGVQKVWSAIEQSPATPTMKQLKQHLRSRFGDTKISRDYRPLMQEILNDERRESFVHWLSQLELPVRLGNLSGSYGRTLCHLAAASHGPGFKQVWLLSTRDPSLCDDFGLTLFHVAAKSGQLENLETMVRVYASSAQAKLIEDLDLRTKAGGTALHLASRGAHVECVRFLLTHGAKVDIASKQGQTPLHLAVQAAGDSMDDLAATGMPAWVAVVKELLLHDADAMCYNRDGHSALHLACMRAGVMGTGLEDRLDDMLTTPGKMSDYSVHGLVQDCSRVAASERVSDITTSGEFARLRRMLEAGANVNTVAALDGATALHLATRPEVAELLVKFNAHIGARDKAGNTPLHKYVMLGKHVTEDQRVELCRFLLLARAEYRNTALNEEGFSPFDLASGQVKLLFNQEAERRQASFEETDRKREEDALRNLSSAQKLLQTTDEQKRGHIGQHISHTLRQRGYQPEVEPLVEPAAAGGFRSQTQAKPLPFEDQAWEVFLTKTTLNTLLQEPDRALAQEVLESLFDLTQEAGPRHPAPGAHGCNVTIFVADVLGHPDTVIVWDIAVLFSLRVRSYTDVIRVHSIESNRDHVTQHVSHIIDSIERGKNSSMRKDLTTNGDPTATRFPRTFVEGGSKCHATYTPSCEGTGESNNIVRYYSLSDNVARVAASIVNIDSVPALEFPFAPAEDEARLLIANEDEPGSTLLLGRSGTGKTTFLVHRTCRESINLPRLA
jgi:ankyrin repeat protein